MYSWDIDVHFKLSADRSIWQQMMGLLPLAFIEHGSFYRPF
ncbi:hypothetical protein [Lederbergia galactosidilytica]|nr:hypothetical protein [Lederbergia galactosidilytica]